MPYIQTEADYRSLKEEVGAKLGTVRKGTPEGDHLDALIDAIVDYEAKHHDLGLPDPIDAIEFMMDQKGLSRRDLEPLIGSRGHVSDVMNRHRPLSLDMIRRLNKSLAIPAEVLIQEYPIQARHRRELSPV